MTATTSTPRSALPPARRSGRRSGRRSTLRSAAWHLGCLALLAVLLYPLAWLLGTSFKPASEIFTSLRVLPRHAIGGNYRQALHGIGGVSLWKFLENSLIISVAAVIGNLVSCSLAGYAFARLRFRMRPAFFAFTIVTIMLPQQAVLIPQYVVFQRMHLVGTFVPLILPKFLATDAFFVFLMMQFMRSLPRELDDAARVDGCGPVRTYTRIVLPLARPALVTTSIFTFIWTWNDFFSQLIYLNKPSTYTLPLALRLFIDQTSQSAFGPMFAMSVLALVPIVLFFLAFQRLLVEGVATTGLKG